MHAINLGCPALRCAVQEHQRYHEVLVAEENKRKALLDIVYALEVGAGGAPSWSGGMRQAGAAGAHGWRAGWAAPQAAAALLTPPPCTTLTLTE